MSAPRVVLLLALVAFALTLLARLPARWLGPLLPQGIVCTAPAGTAWHGSCANLEARGFRAGAVRWTLRPLRLFTGRAAAALRIAPPGATLEGEFALGLLGGSLEGRDVRGEFELQPGGLLPGIPADLNGRVRLALDAVALRGRALTALQGVIEVRDVRQRTSDGLLPLGSYELRFTGAADPAGIVSGTLRDLGGPLDVQGVLTLTPAPGYLLNGTVALRPDAPPGLARQIAFLGSPDANGRRPFAQEATF
jgi:Type II secretion system (T2SS), protein N